ncbi:hypothetical protein JCM9533A_00210 [Catenuloplanes niger JCM 9533]
MQGGLLAPGTLTGAVVEIACDESGFSGTNLLHPGMPVIAHASVDLRVDEAVALIEALRSEFRRSPHELKSGGLLRGPDAPAARRWLLDALRGRAHVHLLDKEFFLVTRVVDLLLGEPSYVGGTRLARAYRREAEALHRGGRAAGPGWPAFLGAFVDLVRTKRRVPGAAERFLHARDTLLRAVTDPAAVAVLTAIEAGRARELPHRRDDDPAIPPPLEPLLPALAETVLTWAGGGRQVLVTHDEQSALTATRLRRLQAALADGSGRSPLAGLVMADSRTDPRVQVADLLAGVARRAPHPA